MVAALPNNFLKFLVLEQLRAYGNLGLSGLGVGGVFTSKLIFPLKNEEYVSRWNGPDALYEKPYL